LVVAGKENQTAHQGVTEALPFFVGQFGAGDVDEQMAKRL
jgi:hypothetical protein